MPNPTRKTLLSKEQAADYLGVTPTQVYRWARAGRIPYSKPGAFVVFDPADLDAFAEATRHPAVAGPLAEQS